MNLLLNHPRQMQNKWSQKHKPHSKKSCLSLKTHITDKIQHELKKEVNNSRHNNTSRNTLNSQLDKSLELAAVTPLPECSLPRPAFQPFADTHSHFILWLSTSQNARAELLGEKGQIPPLGVLHAEADPAPLCAPAALPKAHGREQDRFGTSRFSILSLGLY